MKMTLSSWLNENIVLTLPEMEEWVFTVPLFLFYFIYFFLLFVNYFPKKWDVYHNLYHMQIIKLKHFLQKELPIGMIFKDEIHLLYFQNMLVYFDVKKYTQCGFGRTGVINMEPLLIN